MKCIRDRGKKEYFRIYSIMPFKFSARRSWDGVNEYEGTLERLSQVAYINTQWKNKSLDSLTNVLKIAAEDWRSSYPKLITNA